MTSTCERCQRTVPRHEPACVVDGTLWCRNCNDTEHPQCPGCGSALRVENGQWMGCESCWGVIRTRSRQNWYATKLVTDEQSRFIDLAAFLPSFRLTRSDFESERARLVAAHGVASAGDICWAILNRLELSVGSNSLRTELWITRADFLRKEGRDSSGEMQKLHGMRVQEASNLGAESLAILAGDCCDECAKQDGKILSCKAAMKNLPLPNPRCTRPSDDGGPFPNCICMIIAKYSEGD